MIETIELTFAYQGADSQREVLHDLTISVPAGQFVAVVGHNGSGKSTLAKHFNAILLPSGGKVYIDGMDTSDETLLYAIRETAGMVFQNPDNQIVTTVVEEDVAFAPENMGLPSAEIRRRVDGALAAVGMEGYLNNAPHLLSGGQKQRIAIAGVLAMEPKIVVLDEPTAMLDPVGRREVMNAVVRLNREQKMTVMLITHHMEEAAMADRVLVMKDGRIRMDGTPREIFSKPDQLREMSLTPPQTVELLYETNRRAGAGLSLEALSVEECADQILHWLGE